MSTRRVCLLVMACFGGLGPLPASAAPAGYVITPIVVPGATATYATAINERAQVTGYAVMPDGHQLTFVYSAGTFTYPDTLGARFIVASDINEAGDIAGSYYRPDDLNHPHAFAWIGGVAADLGSLGIDGAVATKIDDRAAVYGQSGHAFAWRDGRLRDLGEWPGHDVTAITGVNADGVAVGYAVRYGDYTHAFVADRQGHRTRLPSLGGVSAAANAVNSEGVVCGWAEVPSGKYHAFRYQHGVMTDLGVLAGGIHSEAFSINAAGDIVGEGNDARGKRAIFVRGGGSQVENLDTLADARAQGWRFEAALGINDRGEIVGYGNRGAFMLTPVASANDAARPDQDGR